MHYPNRAHKRWITRYHRARVHALADLEKALEAEPMSDNTFVYTTYIRTTPEKLWQALTDSSFTGRYWGATFDTDWRPGSEMAWHQRDWTSKHAEQVVLEADPYTKLSYTWHTFDSAFAEAFGMSPDDVAAWGAEPRSKVTFELDEAGDELVELTVVHDGFQPGSAVLEGISGGWPSILSNLETLLETGEVLPEPAG
ncbi:ArsR family transcriptional regulator [Nocardia tenerifensis]|uniref:ArsR family transcriptional regulator n=1 Tax=Nocardia tenerifensis TaxID=228006 RepID=A0A318K2G0_9NOCA|nr:SRPBCC family protein [Nocardia tenerifensis]PXX65471.1 ArsR family transcriptional regulator [Nocardia tenerifensis]